MQSDEVSGLKGKDLDVLCAYITNGKKMPGLEKAMFVLMKISEKAGDGDSQFVKNHKEALQLKQLHDRIVEL